MVNGGKPYVTGGPSADFFSVFLTVEEDGAGPGGSAMVIVDSDPPGLTLDPEFSTLDGATHCPLRFEDMHVPLTHVLGAIGEGMPRALGNIGQMRLGLAAQACGTAMWVTKYVFETLQEREAAGGPPGLRDQARAALGEMMMETYVARSAFYRSARLAESGEDILNEGSIAKLFAAEAAGRIVDQAIQVVGAEALIEGHPLARLFRVTRSWRFSEGSLRDAAREHRSRGCWSSTPGACRRRYTSGGCSARSRATGARVKSDALRCDGISIRSPWMISPAVMIWIRG